MIGKQRPRGICRAVMVGLEPQLTVGGATSHLIGLEFPTESIAI